MGFRPGKTKGPWVGVSGGGSITADQLNVVYPYDSIYVDASAIVPEVTNGPIETRLSIPNTLKRRNALMYNNTDTLSAYFYWPEHIGYVDWSSPQFKMRIFGSSDTSGTGNTIYLDIAVSNVFVSDDESDNVSYPFGSAQGITVLGRGDYNVWQGANADGCDPVSVPSPGGRTYQTDSTVDINNITFRIRRLPGNENDDFSGNFYLYGIAIQFKTDFNNIKQWA